jgi:uncharacterized protein
VLRVSPSSGFSRLPLITGVVHLDPLPGTALGGPSRSLPEVIDRARRDAHALTQHGVNAIIVENFGDVPFARDHVEPHIVSAITIAVAAVIQESALPVGVNVLRNDGVTALSIAAMTGASFIRSNVYVGAAITDQGFIQGNAFEVQAIKQRRGSTIDVWADIDVKHASQVAPRALEELASDAIERGLARAVIVTGSRTGESVNIEALKSLRNAVPEDTLIVGSGVTDQTVKSVVSIADAVIVGSYFKVDGIVTNMVDADRVRRLVAAVKS